MLTERNQAPGVVAVLRSQQSVFGVALVKGQRVQAFRFLVDGNYIATWEENWRSLAAKLPLYQLGVVMNSPPFLKANSWVLAYLDADANGIYVWPVGNFLFVTCGHAHSKNEL